MCFYQKSILGIVASILDPLGILTPSILEAKLIIQSMWAEDVSWDGQILDCLEKRWNNWYQKLNAIILILKCSFTLQDRLWQQKQIY